MKLYPARGQGLFSYADAGRITPTLRVELLPPAGIYETASVKYYIDGIELSRADFLALVEFSR
jgi:hypothetical protein